MQWLAQICVRRPIFATVLMLVIVVIGVVGFAKLGIDEFPSADFPYVTVTTRYEGAAPEEIETDVTDKIEGAVNTISGIETLSSSSYEGVSVVLIGFDLDKDPDVAAQEVRDKVDSVLADLPKGIDKPSIGKVDPDASPIMYIALRSKGTILEATGFADKKVRRQLESVSGVGQVSLVGGLKRQINVWLDPDALRARGLTAAEINAALQAQNLTSPGGSLETGPENMSVRIKGRVDSVEAIGRIIVTEKDGHAIRVEDVAKVEDGSEDETTYAMLDRERAVVLSIRKQSGTNTVAIADNVRARLDQVERSLPEGMHLDVVRDNSRSIRTAINAVEEHLVVGALLAAAVVFLFLANARSTAITAFAIPISIIGTFGAIWYAGFTLNSLTLLALALAVGIVIDDAIVVLENIVRYIEEKGHKPLPAAILATREIGLAVLATTLSLMAVFVPVAFMGGMAGRFLRSFGLTMAFAVGVSLIVSFTLTPALAGRWLRLSPNGRTKTLAERLVDRCYMPLANGYTKLLGWALTQRWVVMVACFLSLASTPFIAKHLPGGFFPEDDNAQFEVALRVPEGSSLTSTRLIAERVAEDIRRESDAQHILLTVGEGSAEESNTAKIYAFLSDPEQRPLKQSAIMQNVRSRVLAKLPKEITATAGEVMGISMGSSSCSVQVAIQGPDLQKLTEVANRVTEGLKKVPGAVDVDSSVSEGKPELQVAVDRDRAATLGVRVADVANTLQLFIGGAKASNYAENGEQYDIRLRAASKYRADQDSLALIMVPSSKQGSIPLANVISTETSAGPSTIERLGRRRQITIRANSLPSVGDQAVEAALTKLIAQEKLDSSYTYEAIGRSKETGRTMSGFLLVFAMAFVFMYLVLAAQFESWLHPLTILVSLPLTVPFALLSLLIFGQSLNMFSILGLLVLFGVVKKNAILQIDHTNQLRSQGMPRFQALLQANRERLRPILMTTLAFVAGMVPLLFSRGIGSGKNQTMGAIVAGGQSLSLLLTLVAVPVFYSLLDDLQTWFARRRTKSDQGEVELKRLVEDSP